MEPRPLPSVTSAVGPVRSTGSGGKDGSRNAGPAAVFFLVVLVGGLSSPGRAQEPAQAVAVRSVEARAGAVRRAASALEAVAGEVAADGRLHSLALLEDLALQLEGEVDRLDRALGALERAAVSSP